MTVTPKKLTAGDGYEYLTRQVAVHDSTERGRSSLNDYYSAKGESPGTWLGAGLSAFTDISAGDRVSESQMKALYGEGRHPDAEDIEARRVAELVAEGMKPKAAAKAAVAETKLGAAYRVYKGASEFRQAVAAEFTTYNTSRGLKWNTLIAGEDRAAIRTKVARDMFTKELGRGPLDEAELSGWVARNNRQKTTAVAGYDLCFSPVKSVSALHAVAPLEVKQRIEKANWLALRDTLAHIEANYAYTRVGTNGVAQVDIEGLIAAAFVHRDSRSGDPDWHVHVVISNKVQTRGADGELRWLALDGNPIYKNAVAFSEYFNTRNEAHLREELGVAFAERGDTDPGKRPIREIVGVDPDLCRFWSSRREAIEVRRGQLAVQFQAEHGREPTPVEATALAQQANLDTRQAKHEPRSEAEQRAIWRGEAIEILGGERALSDMVYAALHPTASGEVVTDVDWIETAADRIVATVATSRARWQPNHVRAEVQRVLRAADVRLEAIDTLADRLTSAVLAPVRSVPIHHVQNLTEPAELRREDDTGVYTHAGSQMYTSEAVLAAEQRLLTAAHRGDGRKVDTTTVDVALLEHVANNPTRPLNAGQKQLVRAFATSGSRVQLALAPAGSGKTTAMSVLTRAWEASGGNVLGLAPTGSAAGVLRDDLGATTDTIDKLTHVLDDITASVKAGKPVRIPKWVRDIDERTLLVIDEAALAGTENLDTVVHFALHRGASVRLVGDDRQQSAIAAGGVLRDIAREVGAVSLRELMRFSDPAEANATLALREGDPAALGFYFDRRRVHTGDAAAVVDNAYRNWKRDTDEGKDSIVLAPTRDMVSELNERARTDRLAAAPDEPVGPVAVLADGLEASAGDIVITRNNDRRLRVSRTDYVRNGYRWRIQHVRSEGSLDVTHVKTGLKLALPAGYVAAHTELGYAATGASSQGVTADTAHPIFTGSQNREDLYTWMTRGRHANHAYLVTAVDGDPDKTLHPESLLPASGLDVLTEMLARSGAQKSATTSRDESRDPHTRMRIAVDAYSHAVGTAAEITLGAEAMARIDTAADTLWDGLTQQPAYPTLRKHLATIAVDGTDPVEALRAAIAYRELDTAHDVAAVLDWRLDTSGEHSTHSGSGPVPWKGAIPATLRDDPRWGEYLTARRDLVIDLAGQIRADAAAWTPSTAPEWARPFVGTDTGLLGDLAVWRAAVGVDDMDRRPTGPDRLAIAERRHQKRLDERSVRAIGDLSAAARRWRPLADTIDPAITRDPFWPVLADRLTLVKQIGTDVHALVADEVRDRPLPDQVPAQALWWRISARLEPAVLRAVDNGDTLAPLRPTWVPDLTDVLGDGPAARVMADPAWPSLVAALDSADPADWTPQQLLEVAHDMLRGGADEEPVRADRLATALAWRVEALLTHVPDRAPLPTEEPVPDEETIPEPDDTAPEVSVGDTVATPDATGRQVSDEDADYLASRVELGPPALDDAPPEDGLTHTEPGLVADTEPGLAGDVLDEFLHTAELQPPRPLPYPDLTPRERLDQLRDDLAGAKQRVTELTRTMLGHYNGLAGGPNRAAAAPMLTEMSRRADEQRPYWIASKDAYHEWQNADRAAEDAAAVAERRRAVAAARAAGDDDEALRLDLDVAVEETISDDRRRVAADAHADYLAAKAALDVFAADHGGPITRADVEHARLLVDDLDIELLNDARRHMRVLDGQVLRAKNALARELSRAAIPAAVVAGDGGGIALADPPALPGDTDLAGIDGGSDTGRPADTAGHLDGWGLQLNAPPPATPACDVDTEVFEDMAIDLPVEEPGEDLEQEAAAAGAEQEAMLVELSPAGAEAEPAVAELADAITALEAEIADVAALQSALPEIGETGPAVAKVRAAHTALDTQYAPIARLREAERTAEGTETAFRTLDRQLSDLTARRDALPVHRRQQRRELDRQITALRTRHQDVRAAHIAAADAVVAATRAVPIPQHQWKLIERRALDTSTRATELAEAQRADTQQQRQLASERTRLSERRDDLTHRLHDIRTEHDRRTGLTVAEAAAEHHAREQLVAHQYDDTAVREHTDWNALPPSAENVEEHRSHDRDLR